MVPRQQAPTPPPPPPVAKVDVYTHRFSADCMRAKALLDRKGAIYSEYIIDSDEESERVMRLRSGGESSVPQIFINGRAIGGVEPLEALDVAGQLDVLLGEAPRDLNAEERKKALQAQQNAQSAEGQGQSLVRGLLNRFGRR
jgi:glutaredoxin 3